MCIRDRFLQNAAISPQSKNTLQSLVDLDRASPVLPFAAATTALPTTQTQQPAQEPTIELPPNIEMPPEFMAQQPSIELPTGIEMPPEFGAPAPQPTTTIDKQRQAIFNQELKDLTSRSMAQQASGDETGVNRTTRDLRSLLMEAARAKVPLSMQ